MIWFYDEEDEVKYYHHLDLYNRTTRDYPSYSAFRRESMVEVMDCGHKKAFKYPGDIEWICFYGTWDELKEQLLTDFPKVFMESLEFYALCSPGIII
jgi:hypothetical protein